MSFQSFWGLTSHDMWRLWCDPFRFQCTARCFQHSDWSGVELSLAVFCSAMWEFCGIWWSGPFLLCLHIPTSTSSHLFYHHPFWKCMASHSLLLTLHVITIYTTTQPPSLPNSIIASSSTACSNNTHSNTYSASDTTNLLFTCIITVSLASVQTPSQIT